MKCHICHQEVNVKALWPQFYFCKECSEYFDYNPQQQKEYWDKHDVHFRNDDDEIKEIEELEKYV